MEIPPRSRGILHLRAARSPITRRVFLPTQAFLHTEEISGLLLLAATAVALVWANSPWAAWYVRLWHTPITVDVGLFRIAADLQHWVNDGLMAIFFFVIGLEIKREVAHGALAERRQAILPLLAAGGVWSSRRWATWP